MNQSTNNSSQSLKKQDLVVTRVFDAPVELVWKAWTDPELVMLWWGPKDYTSPICKIDFREGGQYLFCMRAPKNQGGQDFYSAGVYKKIVPLERLEFTQSLADKDGNIIDPSEVGMPPDFPKVVNFEIDFRDKGGSTELTIKEYDWTLGQMYEYAVAGMNQSLDKLAKSIV
jgi:uncharacterized protein YndB with AHSA1/START domain